MATYWENSCSFGLRYVSWYKYLIVSLVFSHLGFWSGNLFLIAPFPDLCLLVPFCYKLFKNYNSRLIMRLIHRFFWCGLELYTGECETCQVMFDGVPGVFFSRGSPVFTPMNDLPAKYELK